MRQRNISIICLMLISALAAVFSGCDQPAGTIDTPIPPTPPVTVYSFELAPESCNMYFFEGGGFSPPEFREVTVTNTGEQALTLSAELEGTDSDVFVLTPSTATIAVNGTATFTVSIADGYKNTAPERTYTANVLFQSTAAQGNLSKTLPVSYSDVTVEVLNDLTIEPLPLQADGTAALSTTDTDYIEGSTNWFSADESVIKIDEGDQITAVGAGEVFLGFVTKEDPFTVKGKTVRVYPRTGELSPEYPLVDGVLSRLPGSVVELFNEDEIQTADVPGTDKQIKFTITGNDKVISAIDETSGSLTFVDDGEEGDSDEITVNLEISSTVPEGKLVSYRGEAAFTAAIGAPAPVFISARTINGANALLALTIEADFSQTLSSSEGPASTGFTIKKGSDSLTIQNATINDDKITFTLAGTTPILHGDTVTISYNGGTITGNGLPLAAFDNEPVTNHLTIGTATFTVELTGLRAGALNVYESGTAIASLNRNFDSDSVSLETAANNLTQTRKDAYTLTIPSEYIGKTLSFEQSHSLFSEKATQTITVTENNTIVTLDFRPTLTEYANVAPLFAAVSASNVANVTAGNVAGFFQGLRLPRYAVDGNKAGLNRDPVLDGGVMYEGLHDGTPSPSNYQATTWMVEAPGPSGPSIGSRWLAVDFGYPVTLNTVKFHEAFGWGEGYIRSFNIEYSDNGTNWEVAVDQSQRNALVFIYDGFYETFDEITARYWRLNIVAWEKLAGLGLCEFELYHIPAAVASLRAAVAEAEALIAATAVSTDGSEVLQTSRWVTQTDMDTFTGAVNTAKTFLNSNLTLSGPDPVAGPDTAATQPVLGSLNTAIGVFNTARQPGSATPPVTVTVNLTGARVGTLTVYESNGTTPIGSPIQLNNSTDIPSGGGISGVTSTVTRRGAQYTLSIPYAYIGQTVVFEQKNSYTGYYAPVNDSVSKNVTVQHDGDFNQTVDLELLPQTLNQDLSLLYSTVYATDHWWGSDEWGTYDEPPKLAVDGIRDNASGHRWSAGAAWDNTGVDSVPKYLTLEFGFPVTVNAAKIVDYGRTRGFKIEYSNDDGLTWQVAHDDSSRSTALDNSGRTMGELNSWAGHQVTFTPVTGKWFRMVFTMAGVNHLGNTDYSFSVYEFSLFNRE